MPKNPNFFRLLTRMLVLVSASNMIEESTSKNQTTRRRRFLRISKQANLLLLGFRHYRATPLIGQLQYRTTAGSTK